MTDENTGQGPANDAPEIPVEPVADSSPVADTEAQKAPADTADDASPPRDTDGKFLSANVQRRIDELTREKYERAREAEYWRQQAMQQKPEPAKVETPAKLPTLEEHGYDEAKYQAALLQYVEQKAESVVEKRLSEVDAKRKEQQRIEAFAERQRAFVKATPDFEDKVLRDPTLPITEGMRDVIVDSENGPEIAYYLANNREAAEAIARLPAHLAALEMGRIEGRLAAQKEAVTRPPPVSKAPPPPPRVEVTEATTVNVKASDPESDKLSNEEWFRLRNKEVKRKKA